MAQSIDVLYVESSGLLAALLEQDAPASLALSRSVRRVASALTLAESRRALVRGRQSNRLNLSQHQVFDRGLETFAKGCNVIGVTDEILFRAGRPFPVEPIRTLDAIHLASVELLGESPALVTVLTRDTRVRENALALGFSVV